MQVSARFIVWFMSSGLPYIYGQGFFTSGALDCSVAFRLRARLQAAKGFFTSGVLGCPVALRLRARLQAAK
ncbi:hypothetical protein ACP4OV_022875 [Aristida adscensionis]